MIAINVIIDRPAVNINMARGWETGKRAEYRRLWLHHLRTWLFMAARDCIAPANDLIDHRALRHIAGLEQGGFFYEYPA